MMEEAEGAVITTLIQVIWLLIYPNYAHLLALRHHLYKDPRHLQPLDHLLVDSRGQLMQQLQQKLHLFFVPFVEIMLPVNTME